MSKKKTKYNRVLLKISGEALAGKKGFGIDPGAVDKIANEIIDAKETGIELAVVVGGGNFWRGAQEQKVMNLNRVTSDYIGMLSTITNAMLLQDVLERKGALTRVQSAIEAYKLCEPYVPKKAIQHLKKGRIVIFAGGTGNPYFTTDTTAALRANEIKADVILKATQVDGVYTDDPRKKPGAKKYRTLSFTEAIQKRLKVMDTTAFTLCMDNNLPIVVFDLHKRGNIARVINGEKIGTIVTNRRSEFI